QPFAAAYAFDRHNLAPGHQANWHQATVDGPVSGITFRVAINYRHRAGATIALGAAFFGAGQAVLAEVVQQWSVGRFILDPDKAAVQRYLKGIGHRSFHVPYPIWGNLKGII